MPEPGAAKLLFEAGLDWIELDVHYKIIRYDPVNPFNEVKHDYQTR